MSIVSRLFLIGATMFVVGCSSGGKSGSSDELQALDNERNAAESPEPDQQPGPEPQPDPDPQSDDPAAAPTVSLNISDDVVDAGGAVTLNWSSQYATSCTGSGGWSGDKAISGQQQISPLQNNQTFTLNCEGAGGSAVAMVSVSVLGSLQISWQAPTENVDGSAVGGIRIFRIHYGNSSRNYDKVVEVSGNTTSHTLDLIMGEYYIAMTAVDLEGDESALSNEVVKRAV